MAEQEIATGWFPLSLFFAGWLAYYVVTLVELLFARLGELMAALFGGSDQ